MRVFRVTGFPSAAGAYRVIEVAASDAAEARAIIGQMMGCEPDGLTASPVE